MMRKRFLITSLVFLLLSLILSAIWAKAQNQNFGVPILTGPSVPSSCTTPSLFIKSSGTGAGIVQTCFGGVFTAIGGSGTVTGGPFTSNQFAVGNGTQGIKTVAPTIGTFAQDNSNGQMLVVGRGLNSSGWLTLPGCTGAFIPHYNAITNQWICDPEDVPLFQVNATPTANQSIVNFRTTSDLVASNPSVGNVDYTLTTLGTAGTYGSATTLPV